MLTITQVESPAEIAAAQDLLREYTAVVLPLTEGSADPPTFRGLEAELATLPGIYAPPAGRLLLAQAEDGTAAGCVALKGHDATTAELKRLFVRPAFRGQGLAARLVSRLLDEAQAAGYRRIVLDSHYTMTIAHAIYRAYGFRDVAAPDDFPEALKPEVVFMEWIAPAPSAPRAR